MLLKDECVHDSPGAVVRMYDLMKRSLDAVFINRLSVCHSADHASYRKPMQMTMLGLSQALRDARVENELKSYLF